MGVVADLVRAYRDLHTCSGGGVAGVVLSYFATSLGAGSRELSIELVGQVAEIACEHRQAGWAADPL